MARLTSSRFADSWRRSQQSRCLYSELRDPCMAAFVDRHLTQTPLTGLKLIRPLKLKWATPYAAERVIRGFLVAADIGLCRALWMFNCGTCHKDNLQARPLLPVGYCYACKASVPIRRHRPAELIFTSPVRGLREGLLKKWEDNCRDEIEPVGICIAPKMHGILPAGTRTGQIEFSAPLSNSFSKVLAVLLDRSGKHVVHINPFTYQPGGIVVRRKGVLAVANAFKTEMWAQTVPLPDPERINESAVLSMPEYAGIFG